ncbi:DNA repair protein XRCC3 isoform X3 [Nomascus leucogenys]|uniref:DNA repair protein XRCC3 isoform X3 n=2 Tax=Nomascus leucogenys TaxID=61853 RepID=UPI00122DAE7D|nr:DNA repair protein XRCC3 isoform X3 [Nomascus leucogenys]XP_030659627.1 DNA repair protein XRCC3 isoform X3 [Nomascus leucogenys]XP_030659629.1 DNA repair protein XRCC3 isoform X3 [Nomascus leucogenys]
MDGVHSPQGGECQNGQSPVALLGWSGPLEESPGRHLREIKLQSARDASVKSAKNTRVIPEPQRVIHPGGQPTNKMDLELLDLNPRIIAAIKKAKLKSVKEVLRFSGPDLKRLTNLSSPEVWHLLRTASLHLRGSSIVTALQLHQQKQRFPAQHQRLSLGCPVLDALLRGGLPLDGITELAGRSSAGKTQLALQLCLAVQFPRQHGGLEAGAVYICTEDAFPHKRLQQLMAQQPRLRTDVPGELLQKLRFGSQIFIEHVADVDTLLECVNKKVPVLLSRGMARLVIIDSVAAPFRCEFDSQASAPRARRLQSLGAALRELSSAFQSPVLCINQVTEAMEEQGAAHGPLGFWDERVSPALGITWANQLLVRLLADRLREEEAALGCPARTLRVLSAPHLPPSSCSYTISAEGVRGTPGTQSH